MKSVSIDEIRDDLDAFTVKVAAQNEPVLLTRPGGAPLVVLPLAQYQSLMETAFLLDNPENARRLFAAAAQLELAKHQARGAIE
jgi:antitoxin YefM